MRLVPLSVFSAVFGATTTMALPTLAQTDVWALLGEVEIDEIVTDTSYEVKKTFPKQLDDGIQELTITGYAMPLTPGSVIRELLLVSDMGTCPFCGSGDHGTSLKVTLAEPLNDFEDGARITLKGALTAVRDTTTWQSAVLKNAILVDL
jgi:regulator of protease activity HflC (stomatin/prohibitin superfamily)